MSELVQTSYGWVRGLRDNGVRVWRGIPYGRAPIGGDRFCAPRAPESWSEVREAVSFGPIAIQSDAPGLLSGTSGASQSEDCLSLNVWSPVDMDEALAPVLVWIHGGGYVFGSGSTPWYDASSFAQRGSMVVVTMNYRLGPFGFLYLREQFGEEFASSGNAALLDQLLALQWVRDNIANFGGDPHRVTIAGESAGSWSVGALMAMPAAEGLFQQAICESGVPPEFLAPEAASQNAQQVLDALGIRDHELKKLQEVSARDWIEAARSLPQTRMPWLPVLDGTIFPRPFWDAMREGWARHVPLLIGTNHDEAMLWGAMNAEWKSVNTDQALAAFERQWDVIPSAMRHVYLDEGRFPSLFEALVQYATMHTFRYPSLRLAALQSQKAPVWMYRFDWKSTAYGGVLRACHAIEIPFVFHTIDAPGVKEITGDSPDRSMVADTVHQAWIAFAREGDPQTSAIPRWPHYDLENRATMIFDSVSHLERDPEGDLRQLWEAFYDQPPY